MATSGLSARQADVWARYQSMRVRLAGQLNRELAACSGLSEADFEILTALLDTPGEAVRALALRCGLGWEKSRLSHQLRRMEQRGLVTRFDCAEDNRGTVVQITDLGRELAEEATAHYEQAVRRHVVDALTRDQLDALGEIADAVLGGLPRHEPDGPGRS
ncbi:MarR family winged helix-turn-helix transcriptional regulator [Prauserella flavalba]|uniref:MarR family winged helix-turn-helix transcriptional regulator n=1 Tax=Prauserella flavalba TaxID=1477506 RepID=UPI0036E1994F